MSFDLANAVPVISMAGGLQGERGMDETCEQMEARWKKTISEAGAATEKEMRESDVPRPKTPEELSEYIAKLVDRPHDYGTCVYAMSMAAVAAFNYVSHRLGVTGFQASCADMDILRRTRRIKHGFMILNGDDLLYPQYDLIELAREWIHNTLPTLKDEATRLLTLNTAHPDVLAHWKKLSGVTDEGGSE